MRRAALALALILAAVAFPATAAPTCPKTGWEAKFTARQEELHVVILKKGTAFCAVNGAPTGVIVVDGIRSLDDYLPNGHALWTVYGPRGSSATAPPVPTPQPTPPGSTPPLGPDLDPVPPPPGGTIAPAPSNIPNTATEGENS